MPERRSFDPSNEEAESKKLDREPTIEIRGDEVMIGFNRKELAYLDSALTVYLEAERKTQSDWEEKNPNPQIDEKMKMFHLRLIEKLVDRINRAVNTEYERSD